MWSNSDSHINEFSLKEYLHLKVKVVRWSKYRMNECLINVQYESFTIYVLFGLFSQSTISGSLMMNSLCYGGLHNQILVDNALSLSQVLQWSILLFQGTPF